jgi:hypothetical protein
MRPRAADLGLGGVDAQLHPAGLGVGDHVRQHPQPHPRLAGDREAPGGQQRPDLVDRPGDGRAVHPYSTVRVWCGSWNRSTTRVASTRSQKASRMMWAGAVGAPTGMGATLCQRGLVLGGPGVGQLSDEVTKVLPGDAGEARMGPGPGKVA